MPAILPLTVALDALNGSTPRDFTFNPQSINAGIATYLDQTSGVSLAACRFTTSLVRPSKTSKNSKVRYRLVVPVLYPTGHALAGQFDHEMTLDLTCSAHERSTEEQRRDAIRCFIKLLDFENAGSSELGDTLYCKLEQFY